jgi:hypothetical protein
MGDVGGGAVAGSVAAVVPEEPRLVAARAYRQREREGPSGCTQGCKAILTNLV